jgi:single-strand DNA-binding protein
MKAQGLARIGREVEVRYTTGGEAVANISLAFTFGKKGADGNRLTQWVDASLWGKRAETLTPYLKKGSQIVAYLDDVSVQTFTKGDGTQATKMVGRIVDLELISSGEAQQPAAKPQPKQIAGFDDMDSDIPY